MASTVYLSISVLLWVIQVPEAAFPSALDTPKDIAEWKKCIADSGPLYEQGRFSEAARVLEKAVHYAEHFGALDPRLPTTIHALAFLYQQQRKYAEATRLYLRAIQLWEMIGPAQHNALLQSTDNLIATYVDSHDYRAAKKLLAWRLPEMEQSATKWRDRATLLNTRAGIADIERRYDEAELLFGESLALWEQHVPEEDQNLAIVLMNLSHVLLVTKRYRVALEVELRALATLEKLGVTTSSLALRALDSVALVYAKLGRPIDAEHYYQRELATADRVFGPGHAVSAQIMLRYSLVLRRLQRHTEAKLMARQAHEILRRSGQTPAAVDVLALTPTR
jgi:tetratricopeptide (TPR) repeat protein